MTTKKIYTVTDSSGKRHIGVGANEMGTLLEDKLIDHLEYRIDFHTDDGIDDADETIQQIRAVRSFMEDGVMSDVLKEGFEKHGFEYHEGLPQEIVDDIQGNTPSPETPEIPDVSDEDFETITEIARSAKEDTLYGSHVPDWYREILNNYVFVTYKKLFENRDDFDISIIEDFDDKDVEDLTGMSPDEIDEALREGEGGVAVLKKSGVPRALTMISAAPGISEDEAFEELRDAFFVDNFNEEY